MYTHKEHNTSTQVTQRTTVETDRKQTKNEKMLAYNLKKAYAIGDKCLTRMHCVPIKQGI